MCFVLGNVSNNLNLSDKSENVLTFYWQDGEYNWSKPLQGLILSSFFWGYLVAQLPAGWISARVGAKRVMGWCMFTSSVSNLLMPVCAKISPVLVIVLRVISGLCQVCFIL